MPLVGRHPIRHLGGGATGRGDGRPPVLSRRPWLAYLPAALWAALVLHIGSRSWDESLVYLPALADKFAHAILYGGLALLAVFGWRWAGRRPLVWLPFLATLVVGAVDEIRQIYIPTRSGDLNDWLVDAGVAVAVFAVFGRASTDSSE